MLNRIPGPARRFFPEDTQETARNPGRGHVLEFPDRPRAPGRFRQVAASSGTPDTSGAIVFEGVITPSTLVADTHNWNPSGLAGASIIRFSVASNGDELTGLQGGSDGRVIILRNVGSFLCVLIGEDTASTAENRFAINGVCMILPNCSATIIYDGTQSRWVLCSVSDNGVHRKVQGSNQANSSTSGASTLTGTQFGTWDATWGSAFCEWMCAYNSAATTTGAGLAVTTGDYTTGEQTLTATTTRRYFGNSNTVSTTSLLTGNIITGMSDITLTGSVQLRIITEVNGSMVTALANVCFLEVMCLN